MVGPRLARHESTSLLVLTEGLLVPDSPQQDGRLLGDPAIERVRVCPLEDGLCAAGPGKGPTSPSKLEVGGPETSACRLLLCTTP